jgi:Cdc6-like AAA superfamily ATPase
VQRRLAFKLHALGSSSSRGSDQQHGLDLGPCPPGETPSNVLIYGKTGTGKTAVAKYVGSELEAAGAKSDSKCTFIYINCEVIDTQYRSWLTWPAVLGGTCP